MPNGGYPINFMAPIGDLQLCLIAHGSHVRLVELLETSPSQGTGVRHKLRVMGELTTSQTCALTYHLLYWGGSLESLSSDMPTPTFMGETLEPKFRTAGCIYDY